MIYRIPSSRDNTRWSIPLLIGILAIGWWTSFAEARPLTPGWPTWVEDTLEQTRLTSPLGLPHLYPIHLLPTESNSYFLEKDGLHWLARFLMGNRGWMEPETRIDSQQSPRLLPALSGGVALGDQRIRIYGLFNLAQETESDPTHRGLKSWRGDFSLDIPQAGIWLEPFPRFTLFLGRTPLHWGPGYRSALGASGDSPPYDLALWHYQLPGFGKIRVSSTLFATRLDPMWHETPRYLAQRYFMGHRIDCWFGSRLGIGISEFVLYGGEAPSLEIMYLNPIMPYYVSQYNADRDDNVLVTGDFWYRVTTGIAIYGELLVDDYQYARSDSPNALAGLGGFHLLDRLGNEWRLEYVRMNRWVYTHRIPEQQYLHYGTSIGQPLGPDADQWWFRWQRDLAPYTRLNISYTFQRKGEATTKDRFFGGEHWRIPFPSGVVTQTHLWQLQWYREPWSGWQYGGEYRFRMIRNAEHQAGNHIYQHEWRGFLRYRVST